MISWLFEIDTLNLSTKDVTWDSTNYSGVVIPDSFSGVTERWDISGSGLIAPNEMTFDVSNVDADYSTGDFEGEFCIVRYIVDDVETRSWKFKIERAVGYYGKITCYCRDFLHGYLTGDYPNTPHPKQVWPSSDTDEDNLDDYCIPVILGTAYIPLRSVAFTASSRRYVMGPDISPELYDVDAVQTPHDWVGITEYDSASYTMTETTSGGYQLLEPKIDTRVDPPATGVFKSGETFYPILCKYSRGDTDDLTNPAEWVNYLLQDYGIASGDIDSTKLTAASNAYTAAGLSFPGGGWWKKEPRERILSNLLAHTDSYLVQHEKIELHQFSATSQQTFTDVLKLSFSPARTSKSNVDSGSVAWPESATKPMDILGGKAIVPTYDGGTTASPASETLECRFFAGDSESAQKAGTLRYQKKYEQKNRVSFSVTMAALTAPGTLSPGQVVSVNNSLYMGTADLIITEMTFNPNAVVDITGMELNYLEDWSDQAPSAITPTVDDSYAWDKIVWPSPTGSKIGIIINTRDFDTTANFYAYLHGYDNAGDAADVNGTLIHNGSEFTVPSTEDSTNWSVFVSQEGYAKLILDTTLSGKFTVSATSHSIAACKKESDVWYYDNGTAWTEFTPATTDVVIGEINTGATDIVSASVLSSTQSAEGIGNFDGSGADWESNLLNIPDRFKDKASTGINVTADYLGYYDGSDFQVFIQNNGNVQFGNPATGQGFTWNQAAAACTIQGSLTIVNPADVRDDLNVEDGATNTTLLSQLAGDLDDIANGTYGKVLTTDISGGHIVMTSIVGDLDDIDEGTTYGKVKRLDLSAGRISISSASISDVSSGADNTASNETFSSEVDIDYDLIPNGTYGKILTTDIQSGHIKLSTAVGDIDDIDDGSSYAKVSVLDLSSNRISITSSSVSDVGANADNTATNETFSSESDIDYDAIPDGTNYGKIYNTDISAGHIVLSTTIGDLDDIDNGSTYGKVAITDLSAGRISISSSSISDVAANADNTTTIIDGGVITTGTIRDSGSNLVIDFANAEITVNSADGLLIDAAAGLVVNSDGGIKCNNDCNIRFYTNSTNYFSIGPYSTSTLLRIWPYGFSTGIASIGIGTSSTRFKYVSLYASDNLSLHSSDYININAGYDIVFNQGIEVDGDITGTWDVKPVSDGVYDLGSTGLAYATAYVEGIENPNGYLTLNDDVYVSGNVGINTTSPTYELDVVGDIGMNYRLYHNGDATTYIQFTVGRIDIDAPTAITLDSGSSVDLYADSTWYQFDSAYLAATDTPDLGTSTSKWDDIYLVNSPTVGSDEKEKSFIQESDLGLDFIKELQPKKWIWNGRTRPHYGLVAQEVEAKMQQGGFDFAGLVKSNHTRINRIKKKLTEEESKSTIPPKEEVIVRTEQVKPDDEIIESFDSYGLRYIEFIGPIIKAVQEIDARLVSIENKLKTQETIKA